MLVFGFLTFGFHTAWLVILIKKKRRTGNTSNKYYASAKMLWLVAELICLIFFIVRSQDTIEQSTEHEK